MGQHISQGRPSSQPIVQHDEARGQSQAYTAAESPIHPASAPQWSGWLFSTLNGYEWRPQTGDSLHAFQGYGSVDAREMPLELSHAGSLASLSVNLADSFSNRVVDTEHSVKVIRLQGNEQAAPFGRGTKPT